RALRYGLGRIGPPGSPVQKRFRLLARAVEHRGGVSLTDQMARHGRSHDTGTDPADAGLARNDCEFGHSAFLFKEKARNEYHADAKAPRNTKNLLSAVKPTCEIARTRERHRKRAGSRERREKWDAPARPFASR